MARLPGGGAEELRLCWALRGGVTGMRPRRPPLWSGAPGVPCPPFLPPSPPSPSGSPSWRS
eukprot:14825203-Alexandrium_andersonii.AAC.1